ncbi:hypothetical protein X744_06000 [Mesorhizobium sp. LNJC372A00]|nr:hypothetical protein X745_06185 [Mesorhizobium sp. LNJC374B00]ESY61285.1 hypothetical protein X744_06000 [Mesorhizobium sp. LNJC372A00]
MLLLRLRDSKNMSGKITPFWIAIRSDHRPPLAFEQ